MINKNSKIFITGHKGLVGSSVYSLLEKKGYKNLIIANRNQLNLIDTKKVEQFLKKKKLKLLLIVLQKLEEF